MKKLILTAMLGLGSLACFSNTISFVNFTNCKYIVNIDGYGFHGVEPNGFPTAAVTSTTFDMRVLKIGWVESWSLSMPIGDVSLGYPPNNNSNANGLPVPYCVANPALGYTASFTGIGGGNFIVIIN